MTATTSVMDDLFYHVVVVGFPHYRYDWRGTFRAWDDAVRFRDRQITVATIIFWTFPIENRQPLIEELQQPPLWKGWKE